MSSQVPFNNEKNLVMVDDPQSAAAEAYRTLCTNIIFSNVDKPVRTLLVTSVRPGENKSVTIANLALTFAQLGHRVALVDADLRRPGLHSIFGVPNTAGLTSFVAEAGNGRSPNSPVIPFVKTGVENLKLLASGPQPFNSSEILSSTRMQMLINQLREEADYVLFDAPPVLSLTDASVLATRVDGTLLVIRAGKTNRDDAREAKEQLEKVHAHLLGVVLSEVKQKSSKYRY